MADITRLSPELLEEWNALSPDMQTAWADLSQEGLEKILKNKLATRPKRMAEQADLTRLTQRFAERGQAMTQKATGGEGEQLLSAIGIALGTVGGITASQLHHENPADYHCEMKVLVTALQGLEDADTRVDIRKAAETISATISQQQPNGNFEQCLAVEMTQHEDCIRVKVGSLQALGLASAAVKAGEKAFTTGRNLLAAGQSILAKAGSGNLFGALQTLNSTASSTLESLTGGGREAVQNLMVKMFVWKAMDEAAKPFEDAYWEKQDEASRKAREDKRAQQAKESTQKCPGCSTLYSEAETACTACGIPRMSF